MGRAWITYEEAPVESGVGLTETGALRVGGFGDEGSPPKGTSSSERDSRRLPSEKIAALRGAHGLGSIYGRWLELRDDEGP